MAENIIKQIENNINKVVSKIDGSTNYIDTKYAKHIIGVIGTSGSGVSSFVPELALYFAQKRKNVLVIDADLLYPFQNTYNIEQKDVSFVDSVGNPTKINTTLIKSKFNEKLEFSYQDYLSLTAYIQNSDDFKKYKDCVSLLNKLETIYDLIVIDFNSYLLNNPIVQALIKKTQLFILMYEDTIKSIKNKQIIRDNIGLTISDDVQILDLKNKVKISDVKAFELPFEKEYEKIYNNGEIFTVSGPSDTDNYIQSFNKTMEKLVLKMENKEI